MSHKCKCKNKHTVTLSVTHSPSSCVPLGFFSRFNYLSNSVYKTFLCTFIRCTLLSCLRTTDFTVGPLHANNSLDVDWPVYHIHTFLCFGIKLNVCCICSAEVSAVVFTTVVLAFFANSVYAKCFTDTVLQLIVHPHAFPTVTN